VTSRPACQGRLSGIKSKELDDAVSVPGGWAVMVLFPFLNGTVSYPNSQHLSQLCHGQVRVNPLFAKVFAQGFGVHWIAPQQPKMLGN